MLSGKSWNLTANGMTTADDIKSAIAFQSDMTAGMMDIMCGTKKVKGADRVVPISRQQGMEEPINLQLIRREEDINELRKRWSEVPGLFDDAVVSQWPPLLQAVHDEDCAEVTKLLEAKADPDQTTGYMTGVMVSDLAALHVASAVGSLDIVQILLDFGATASKSFEVRDNQFHKVNDSLKCAEESERRLSAQISERLSFSMEAERSRGHE